jgi:hypothetical protein
MIKNLFKKMGGGIRTVVVGGLVMVRGSVNRQMTSI